MMISMGAQDVEQIEEFYLAERKIHHKFYKLILEYYCLQSLDRLIAYYTYGKKIYNTFSNDKIYLKHFKEKNSLF